MVEGIPIAVATPVDMKLVEVVAPATLQAGYTFLAQVNGKAVNVVVPEGGVKEGDRFTVTVALPSHGETSSLLGSHHANGTPRGRWRDGLWDCLSLGIFHPSLWNAWCCPLILMGQVLTRMNMSWLGEPDAPQASKTFPRMVWLVVLYIAINVLCSPSQHTQLVGTGVEATWDVVEEPPNPVAYFIYQVTNFAYGLYSLVILVRLRRAVRERYSLPNQTPFGDLPEDICCSVFCACCTNAQLARHTADYQDHRAVCCSSTGVTHYRPPTVLVV